MDELELLKKDWQKKEQKHPRLTYSQIYDMLFKKSTSIVKWIFIISIAELLLWIGLSLVSPKSTYEILETLEMLDFMMYSNIIHYLVFIIFIYLFYKNYTAIRVTDSTKKLMNSILKTRKTVRYFVIYNVTVFILSFAMLNVFYVTKSELLMEYMAAEFGPEVNRDGFFTYFITIQVVFGILMIGLLILFYRLVYGILLKRLNKNYKELERIEV